MPPPAPFLSKLKTNLKTSIQRLRLTQQRDDSLSKQSRRQMAHLLESGKHASARIRTENIIRADLQTELHEMLELYCELLLARIGMLETPVAGKKEGTAVPLGELDGGIYEALVVLVYVAPRTEIRELMTVRSLLGERYGRGFVEEAGGDGMGVVPERVKRKMRTEAPGGELVESYLRAIASAYEVAYGGEGEGEVVGGESQGLEETEEEEETRTRAEEEGTTDAWKEATPSPPRQLAGAKSPINIAPPSPRTDNANPTVKVPPGPPELKPNERMKKAGDTTAGKKEDKRGGPGGQVPDVDDLEARFKLLKR